MTYPTLKSPSFGSRRTPWHRWLFAAALAGGLSQTARADFLTPTHWSRSSPFSTYQEWDIFSSPSGPNTPDISRYPGSGLTIPNAYDISGNSFIPGSGNIYSFSGVTNIKVDLPDYSLGGDYVTTVLLQVRTLGTEPVISGPDRPRLTITGTGNTLHPNAFGEQQRISLGGAFGGDQVDYAFLFHVPTSASGYQIAFDSAGSSMSLDRIAVDSIVTRGTLASFLQTGMNPYVGFVPQPVPEPGGLAVLGVAACGLLMRRRRSAS